MRARKFLRVLIQKRRKLLMKRRKFSFIVSFLLLLLITVMALPGCGSNERNNSNEETQEVGSTKDENATDSTAITPPTEIGEGQNSFHFEVITEEKESYFWIVHTNETMVGDALLEHDLVQGDITEFGLFVTEINGIVADFDDGGAFWAFYIDGDFAMTGAMETEIEPDTTYAFVFSR
jgi:hypothetical protein